jgi:hypothetical protein
MERICIQIKGFTRLLLSMKEESMRLLEVALAGPNCVVSVMGDHAGEGADEIFNRKKPT